MTDRDPGISALFEQLVPLEAEPRDWQRLLLDAGDGGNRPSAAPIRWVSPRVLLAVVVLLLAVLVPLTALAVGRGWWFLSAYGPQPVGKVVTVSSGRWQGTPWTLTAFRTKVGTICFEVTINPGRLQLLGSSEACGPVSQATPISFLRSVGATPLANMVGRSGVLPRSVPAYVVGAVVGQARQIEIARKVGGRQRVATIAAPAALHADVRFFIDRRPIRADVQSLSALDDRGNLLARMVVEGPPTIYQLANPGRPLPLSHAAIHVLRLHHRSPHIYLLASRDGQNLYRLGTDGRCYGTGKAINLRWNPPQQVMRIVGVIECGGSSGRPTQLRGPLLDLSIYGQTRGQKLMAVYSLAAIASTVVTTVDLVNATGIAVQRIPVVNGVVTDRALPHGIVAIAPLNADGVWLTSCGFGKGSLPILFMRC